MQSFLVTCLLLASQVVALDGINIEPPSCTNRCIVDSMFVTPCQDIDCLCHEEQFQKVRPSDYLQSWCFGRVLT